MLAPVFEPDWVDLKPRKDILPPPGTKCTLVLSPPPQPTSRPAATQPAAKPAPPATQPGPHLTPKTVEWVHKMLGTFYRDDHGFPHGTGKEEYFYKSGALKIREDYVAGKITKSVWHRPDGSVLKTTEWRNESGEGIYLREDGTVKVKMQYKNGRADGLAVYSRPDGTVERQEMFKDGKPAGQSDSPATQPAVAPTSAGPPATQGDAPAGVGWIPVKGLMEPYRQLPGPEITIFGTVEISERRHAIRRPMLSDKGRDGEPDTYEMGDEELVLRVVVLRHGQKEYMISGPAGLGDHETKPWANVIGRRVEAVGRRYGETVAIGWLRLAAEPAAATPATQPEAVLKTLSPMAQRIAATMPEGWKLIAAERLDTMPGWTGKTQCDRLSFEHATLKGSIYGRPVQANVVFFVTPADFASYCPGLYSMRKCPTSQPGEPPLSSVSKDHLLFVGASWPTDRAASAAVSHALNALGFTPAPEHDITPEAMKHRLTWEVYDGTGDAERAVYVLDGEKIGTGFNGLKALCERIVDMPRGSSVRIMPYYGDPGGAVRRKYPFDAADLADFAKEHGVTIGIQKAG